MPPRVSFVVPCYKYGRFLAECLNSILGQTCRDLEVLVMDDCSPDETPEVARAYAARDPRVTHVRNDPNLGHLRNYNKGISLARGEYIWLISADDKLVAAHVLKRYLGVLDHHPEVAFAFCPAVVFGGADEPRVAGGNGDHDRIVPGERFFREVVSDSRVMSPSVLARKKAYMDAGLFPLDLPHQGDVYVWACFAMSGDAAYFAEPMVGYRRHGDAMTLGYFERSEVIIRDQIEIPWRLKRRAEAAGRGDLAEFCLSVVGGVYARYLAGWVPSFRRIDAEYFERSLAENAATEREKRFLRAIGYAALGDHHHDRGERDAARVCYRTALERGEWDSRTWLKYRLAGMGRIGARLRSALIRARAAARRGTAGSPVATRGG